jgi:hypothetical protein
MFLPMIPLAKFVSDDGTTIAGIKLLGASKDDAWKAITRARWERNGDSFVAPITETEIGVALTTVDCIVNDRKMITGYATLFFTDAFPTAKDQILATFEKKWGKPKPGMNLEGRDVLVFKEQNPQITVRSAENLLVLNVEL